MISKCKVIGLIICIFVCSLVVFKPVEAKNFKTITLKEGKTYGVSSDSIIKANSSNAKYTLVRIGKNQKVIKSKKAKWNGEKYKFSIKTLAYKKRSYGFITCDKGAIKISIKKDKYNGMHKYGFIVTRKKVTIKKEQSYDVEASAIVLMGKNTKYSTVVIYPGINNDIIVNENNKINKNPKIIEINGLYDDSEVRSIKATKGTIKMWAYATNDTSLRVSKEQNLMQSYTIRGGKTYTMTYNTFFAAQKILMQGNEGAKLNYSFYDTDYDGKYYKGIIQWNPNNVDVIYEQNLYGGNYSNVAKKFSEEYITYAGKKVAKLSFQGVDKNEQAVCARTVYLQSNQDIKIMYPNVCNISIGER